MLFCLCLYHPTVTSLAKCKLLRMIFYEEDFEIIVHSHQIVMIYVWNIEVAYVWKAVRSFEIANIKVGYGFGKVKQEAKQSALLHLKN